MNFFREFNIMNHVQMLILTILDVIKYVSNAFESMVIMSVA